MSERLEILNRLRSELEAKVKKAKRAYDFDPLTEAFKTYDQIIQATKKENKTTADYRRIHNLIKRFENLRKQKKDFSGDCKRLVNLRVELRT